MCMHTIPKCNVETKNLITNQVASFILLHGLQNYQDTSILTESKPFRCDQFSEAFSLYYHLSVFILERRILAVIGAIKHSHSLYNHQILLIHTVQKLIRGDQCNKAFSLYSDL